MVEMHNLFQTQNPCYLVLHILLGLQEGVPTHPREEGKLNNHLTYCWSENTPQTFFKQCGSGFEQKHSRIDGFGEKMARIGGSAYPYSPLS